MWQTEAADVDEEQIQATGNKFMPKAALMAFLDILFVEPATQDHILVLHKI